LARTKAPTVRLVKSKEDRKRPSVFTRLKVDESFKAHAIFEPDPELEDNPGYLEYYDHWDQQGQAYVPCAGDQCPFCHANQNPSTRALTVWFFPDNEKDEQLKVFTANFGTIGALTDESEDEDGIIGKKLRIKRLSDRGEYRVKTLGEKALTKTEVKSLLKQASELNLQGMLDRQLQIQMERLRAIEALEEDEDEEEEAPKARRGKEITAEADEDEEEEDEDEEEEEDEDEEESDEDEEEEEESDEEEDEDEDEEEGISEASYVVVKLNESEETIDLEDEGGRKTKMWFGDGVTWEADELTKGSTVTISAATDDEGDWVITELEVVETAPKAKRGRPKSSPKGSGSKGKNAPKSKGRGKTKK
jgi:hypothetical protein